LIRAIAIEIHENWIEATRCLNLEPLSEQRSAEEDRIGELKAENGAWGGPLSTDLDAWFLRYCPQTPGK